MYIGYKYFLGLLLTSTIASCQSVNEQDIISLDSSNVSLAIKQIELDTTSFLFSWQTKYNYKNALINSIQPPKGYERINTDQNSFANWLRHLPLKNENTVYLFNGEEKHNQSAQYKVIDIDVGNKDLQQCADAVMRLRAEYLYATNQYSKIHFNYTNGVNISFEKWGNGLYPNLKGNKINWVASSNNKSYSSFRKYMNNIFMYAGTASLDKELNAIELNEIQIGDVFIKGGFPGHAVIVVDVALNKVTDDKCFMVAQSYMPAQNIHILNNNSNDTPWYSVRDCENIIETPEWTFYPNQLKRFN